MVRDTQSTLEGPPKRIERPWPMVPHLETIDEEHSFKQDVGIVKQNLGEENKQIKDTRLVHIVKLDKKRFIL